MPLLPRELILIILKYRKNISWNIRKTSIQNKLSKCLASLHIHRNTNFEFRGYNITWYQAPNMEITISQRPNWVVVAYMYSIPNPDPEKEYPLKVVYCPMFHRE